MHRVSTRDESLTVRFSEDELADLSRLAGDWGVSLGGAIRKLIADACAPTPPDELTFYGANHQKISYYLIAAEHDFVVDTAGHDLPMQIYQVEFRRTRRKTGSIPPIPR
jgi:hypothetical protein